nr:immunoglobulin heavy chain junction region [Macaca mulatta]
CARPRYSSWREYFEFW